MWKTMIINLAKKLMPFAFKKTKESIKDVSGIYKHEDLSSVDVPINKKSALIFIHGFNGNKDKTWGDTFAFLKENKDFANWDFYSYGYNSGLLPNILKGIWIGQASLEELGFGFRGEIETKINKGYNSVSICAHSMGGLVTQSALLNLESNYLNKLNSVILFGTPSLGLEKAELGKFINDQVRDMGAKSPFISNLRSSWSSKFGIKPPFKFLAVAGDTDEFVPKKSSIKVFPEEQRKIIGGNHLRIVCPKSKDDQSITTIEDKILRDVNYRYDWEPATMALERADFQEAKEIYEKTGFDNLMEADQVRYVLCLEALGLKEEASSLSERIRESSSETACVVAGRYKRSYLANKQGSDFELALSWYNKGFDQATKLEEEWYAAINLAFMHLLKSDRNQANKWATIALNKAIESTIDNHWEYATQAEAYLHKGDFDKAMENYKAALERTSALRDKESILLNAINTIDNLGFTNTQKDMLWSLFLGKA